MPQNSSDALSEVGSGKRLSSWKEIAAYLKCGVRTVQRWEKTEGCPVHRHLHQTQGSIYAFTSEIDEWLEGRASAFNTDWGGGQRAPQLPILVGRVPELARLQTYWNRVAAGTRQVVFVDGAIGVGKTALVRSFLYRLDGPLIIQGQCAEQYGAGEAYLPVIEGLTRLIRDRSNKQVSMVLAKYAPSWVRHLPDFPNRESLPSSPPGGKPETMVRELIEALDVLGRDRSVVLFLEDLHWSDWSTVELIDRIARRPDTARVLVIGTYRLEESADKAHPLRRIRHELTVHGQCQHIHVPPLTRDEVAESLEQRGVWTDVDEVSAQLYQWTGGIPLFLNVLIDHLIDTGGLRLEQGKWTLTRPVQTDAPLIAPQIRHIIDDRLRRLTAEERRLLEAASVAGQTFLAAVVAGAVRLPLIEVEQVFQSLARRHQFIDQDSADDSLEDVASARYGFLHSLYQRIVYDQLSPSSRVDLHRATGLFLERAYHGGRTDLAAELAMHFERSRDFVRAVAYYDRAAAVALARNADHEAHTCAVKALHYLARVPGSPERDRQELSVRLKVCAALSNVSTMGDPRVGQAYSDALDMCERVGDDAQVVPALLGIARFHDVRGDVKTALHAADRALSVARAVADPRLVVQALQHLSVSHVGAGRLAEALAEVTEGIELSEGLPPDADALVTCGFYPVVAALTVQSSLYWFLGFPDRALRSAHAAVARAEQLSHSQTLAFAKAYSAVVCEQCGVHELSQDWAESSLALAKQFEFPFATVFAEGVLAWILSRRGLSPGIEELTHAVNAQQAMGIRLWVPMMKAWLAESLLRAGDPTAAALAIDDALHTVRQMEARFYEAELYGVKADVLAQNLRNERDERRAADVLRESEVALRQSFDVAAAQGAKSLQLRAAMRLARLATTAPASKAALNLLSDTYGWFSEGFTTRDLTDARMLLRSTR